jgi:hypothetical protein
MKTIWQQFQAWLVSKNITTHTVGLGLFAFAVAYTSSPALRDQISTLFIGHPVVVTKIGIACSDIVILCGIWAKFSHSSSAAGTVANAAIIKASPDAPTAAQVDAASTK